VKSGDVGTNAVSGGKVLDNSLRSSDVAALTGGDVTDNSLGGGDVNESSLGQVPSAANAGNASTWRTAPRANFRARTPRRAAT